MEEEFAEGCLVTPSEGMSLKGLRDVLVELEIAEFQIVEVEGAYQVDLTESQRAALEAAGVLVESLPSHTFSEDDL